MTALQALALIVLVGGIIGVLTLIWLQLARIADASASIAADIAVLASPPPPMKPTEARQGQRT